MTRAGACLLGALLVVGSVAARAQDPADARSEPPAGSLDALLELVREGRATEASEQRDREARFRAARDEQADLLADARRRLAGAEATSESLEETYDANERRIVEVTEQLDRRLGSLRELFGVLQQVTGDVQGLVESSVTSAEIPDRSTFLVGLNAKLSSSSRLPSIEEIERLWYVMQEEMTETGKVVSFPARVIAADGREMETTVCRVGAFNVVSRDGYLRYSTETGNLSELARQPRGRFVKSAQRLLDAEEGRVTFGIDPTRGQVLASYLDRPSLGERVRQGGPIGYIIIALGVLGVLLAGERLVTLAITERRVAVQLARDVPQSDNPLGRVLAVADRHRDADVETLELKLGEAVFRETPRLTRTLLFIKIISVVAPLLGLLGTVTGMIVTFQAITLFGTGDPKLMAGGISQALVTTVLGLSVAIPIVLLHTIVSGRSRRILHVLREQSAGIVAERSEEREARA